MTWVHARSAGPIHRVKGGMLCLLILMASLCAIPAQAGVVDLRTAAQEHSLSKYNPANPKAPGLSFEIASAIEKIDPGLTISGFGNAMPLPRILGLMKAEQLDIVIGIFHTAERESMVDYLQQPLYQVNHWVAVRADDPITLSGMDDLRKAAQDNVVMTMQGTAYEAYLRKAGVQNVDVGTTDLEVLLKKLINGRGRFVYESDLNLTEAIRKFHLQDKVRILPVSFGVLSQFAAVRKGLDRNIAARLEADLEKLAKSGELKRIFSRYAPR